MFRATPTTEHHLHPMVDLHWACSGDEVHLGAIGAGLWNEIQHALKRDFNTPARADYPHLLEKGARNLAMRALAKRNRSKQWVFEMLLDCGVPRDLADRIGKEMAKSGYADERSLKDRIVREAQRRGRGSHWVRHEVKKHRVSEECAHTIIQRSLSGEVESILHWFKSQVPPLEGNVAPARRLKIFQKLLRRGYCLQSVESALVEWRSEDCRLQ